MHTARRCLEPNVIFLGLLTFVFYTPFTAAQTRLTDNKPNAPAESWVLDQIAVGEIADLKKNFSEEADRVLSAKFIEDLLTNKDAKVHRRGVRIANAVIHESIDLQGAEIPFLIRFSNCRFDSDVNFSQGVLAKNVILDGSIFNGFIRFVFTEVKGYLSARNTQFNNATERADFNNLRVSGDVFLDGAIFKGPVSFVGSNIGGTLQGEGSKFNDTKEGENFASMTIGEHVFLRKGTIFEGSVLFKNSDIEGNFDVTNTRFNSKEGKVDFSSMTVGKNVLFTDTVFMSTPDFTSMAFRDMDAKSWEGLLSSIRESGFRPDVYTNLEAYYRRAGYIEIAKRIHIEGKRHERRSMSILKQPLEYVWNWVQDVTSGYGQRLSRALIWSACFILVGVFVFRHEEGMETQKEELKERCRGTYRPFWYSLALFLPIVSLEDAKVWAPKLHRRKARLYMRVHIILGYLLIPIGLAAWTGIIR